MFEQIFATTPLQVTFMTVFCVQLSSIAATADISGITDKVGQGNFAYNRLFAFDDPRRSSEDGMLPSYRLARNHKRSPAPEEAFAFGDGADRFAFKTFALVDSFDLPTYKTFALCDESAPFSPKFTKRFAFNTPTANEQQQFARFHPAQSAPFAFAKFAKFAK